MSVLSGSALISVGFEILMLATYARTARRAYGVRRLGICEAARTACTRPVITLTCVYILHRISTRLLLMRWVERAVRRFEEDLRRNEEQPSPS